MNLYRSWRVVYLFYILAALLILQGLFSLLEGIQFRAFIHRSLQEPVASFTPQVSIIAPCKGIDPELEENFEALFKQNYPDYEIIFAIASRDDPARPLIEKAMATHPQVNSRLIIATSSSSRSEKISNLLSALDYASAKSEALAFVDSDARAHKNWLRALVAPLGGSGVGAATGYRWYLPERGGFWSAALSAWNGSVATTLGSHSRNFAWGGATAILRETFERVDLRGKWQGAVSDDYALTRAMQEAGLGIIFVPRCLMLSRQDVSFGRLLEFTTRQVIITRVYRPRVWWAGLISSALFAAVFFGGIAFTFSRAVRENITVPLLMLATIYLLGSMKGALRLLAAREALPQARERITSLWWMFCFLWPLVSLIFLYNFIKSAMTRRINWRGVCYEMRSPTETAVISKPG
jgi:cellulose synthase/poly-beta-1,6-N-acetylglucosamine synthase-like glycosyltransferase